VQATKRVRNDSEHTIAIVWRGFGKKLFFVSLFILAIRRSGRLCLTRIACCYLFPSFFWIWDLEFGILFYFSLPFLFFIIYWDTAWVCGSGKDSGIGSFS